MRAHTYAGAAERLRRAALFPTGHEADRERRADPDPGPAVRTRQVDAIGVAGHPVATSRPASRWSDAIEFPPFAVFAEVVALVPVVGNTAVGPPFDLKAAREVAAGQPLTVEVW